jgi:hypothetical protein
MHRHSIFPLLLLAALLPAAASAQTPAAGNAARAGTVTAPEHTVEGFRSARFGMRAAEVRAAIARDFEVAPAVKEVENAAEGTTLLVVELPTLDPGPGAATVTYIFGASSKRLMHVNVAWTSSPTATEAERNRYTGAGLQLAKYFQALPWKANGTTANRPAGPNGLLLFAGLDRKNSAVELHLAGIAIVQPAGPGPEPTGPTQLRIAYIANVQQPDVATVKAGAF